MHVTGLFKDAILIVYIDPFDGVICLFLSKYISSTELPFNWCILVPKIDLPGLLPNEPIMHIFLEMRKTLCI